MAFLNFWEGIKNQIVVRADADEEEELVDPHTVLRVNNIILIAI